MSLLHAPVWLLIDPVVPALLATRVSPPGITAYPSSPGHDEAAEHRRDAASRPRRRSVGAEPSSHRLLADPRVGLGLDPRPAGRRARPTRGPDPPPSCARGRGDRLEHQLVEVAEHLAERRRARRTTTSAPTAARSCSPSSCSASCGRNGEQRRVLEHAAAERVDDRDAADPARLDQPGHAEVGVGPQLERIAPRRVDPAQDHVDRLEAAERAHPHPTVAHPQVGALHERVAEVRRRWTRARRRSRSTARA